MAAPELPAGDSVVSQGTTGGEHGFTVRLKQSGQEYWVPPGMSILQTLEAAGMCLPYSCREGMCGSCEQRLVGGQADHRDYVLSDEQRAADQSILICVSRARGNVLEIDL